MNILVISISAVASVMLLVATAITEDPVAVFDFNTNECIEVKAENPVFSCEMLPTSYKKELTQK